jgi:hypothetical protein
MRRRSKASLSHLVSGRRGINPRLFPSLFSIGAVLNELSLGSSSFIKRSIPAFLMNRWRGPVCMLRSKDEVAENTEYSVRHGHIQTQLTIVTVSHRIGPKPLLDMILICCPKLLLPRILYAKSALCIRQTLCPSWSRGPEWPGSKRFSAC